MSIQSSPFLFPPLPQLRTDDDAAFSFSLVERHFFSKHRTEPFAPSPERREIISLLFLPCCVLYFHS